jgi:hypothetical protein
VRNVARSLLLAAALTFAIIVLCRHRSVQRALRDKAGAACASREGPEVRVDERVPSAVVAAFRPVAGGISSICKRCFNSKSVY